MMRSSSLVFLLSVAFSAPLAAADPGFRAEVKVEKPTRLDWEFVAAGFGADAGKLPSDYLSYHQRYQLFVPADYDAKKAWPLVVFLSPGDDPLGWRICQKVCEDHGMLFCAAYRAGSNQTIGTRLRITLDMFDDVRRHYRIDPEQTYFAGLGDGGRLASAVAFGLPELCGGVVLIDTTPMAARLDYLRRRTQERLSVALVSGEKDANHREVVDYWQPYYQELAIRTRLWSVKKDRDLPAPEVLAEVCTWLADDLPRRRKDGEARPKLAWKPDDAFDGPAQAARLLEAGQAEAVVPGRLYAGFTMMQGVAARWPKSDAAEKAALVIREMQLDQRLKQQLAEETAAEQRRLLTAQARSQERLGDLGAAQATYEKLAATQPDGEAATRARQEAKRLKDKLAATPYLGVAFADDGVTVQAVAANGPAQRAGLRPGDQIVQLGALRIESLADLRKALQALKPGDKTTVGLRREAKTLTVPLEITAPPPRRDE